MTKVQLNNLANLQNEASAVSIINNNNDALETFSNNTLSRDGTQPNQMGAELDMNSNRILNLPQPITDTEPVRLIDVAVITEPASGNVTSIATPVGGELTQYSGSTGKVITQYNSTGILKTASGVPSAATQGTDYYAPSGTDVRIVDGGTGQSTALAAFDALKQSSTSSYVGAVQLATTTEATTGTNTTKAVTPAGLPAYYNSVIGTSLLPYSPITRTVTSKSASYTLALVDAGDVLIYASTSAGTFTIPTNASVAFPVGTQIDFIVGSSGKLTISPASGVTLIASGSQFSISQLYGAATLLQYGANAWILFGNIST